MQGDLLQIAQGSNRSLQGGPTGSQEQFWRVCESYLQGDFQRGGYVVDRLGDEGDLFS